MPIYIKFFATVMCGGLLAASAIATSPRTLPSLVYDANSGSPAPIPPVEQTLQTVIAEPWLHISSLTPSLSGLSKPLVLEGPAFDRQDNLLLVDVVSGRLMRIDPSRNLTTILPENPRGSAGIGIHESGKIFVTGIGSNKHGGSIITVKSDGSDFQFILKPDLGYVPNDIAFDRKGGFYFTDSKGSNSDPIGSVLYVSSDFNSVTRIIYGLSAPNGVTLSPDEKVLWVGEMGKGLLHRVRLSTSTTIDRGGWTIPYHFTGYPPDGMRVDRDGNLYVGLVGAGRVLVFNHNGVPIGQILVPEGEYRNYLLTTSVAIKPGTNEIYFVASASGERSAMIFRAGAFAVAPALLSHR